MTFEYPTELHNDISLIFDKDPALETLMNHNDVHNVAARLMVASQLSEQAPLERIVEVDTAYERGKAKAEDVASAEDTYIQILESRAALSGLLRASGNKQQKLPY